MFLKRLEKIKEDIFRLDNAPPTTTDVADLVIIDYARLNWCIPSAQWVVFLGTRNLQQTVNENPAEFVSLMARIAYDCSNRLDFGQGRRGVPKVYPEVASEIPGTN